MSVAWDDVVLLAPSLSTTDSSAQDLILAMVDRQIDAERWGEFADDGALLLAAHLGTMSAGGAGSGPVTSETLGAMSRSYAAPMWLKSSLSLTRFGVEYARLLRIACGPAAMVP